MSWLSGQFTTRVIALIPVAIAINIALGYTVQTVLKLPIYLDSIGTILVGVLAGPIAGAVTGAASNIIWQYAPGIGGGTIGPFAITAAVIGILAGLWGYLGVYRPRPATGTRLWLSVLVGVAIIFLLALPIVGNPAYEDPSFFVEWFSIAIVAIAVLLAAALAAFVFGGVTGGGTDVIVAALRQGGADVLSASLGQGFFSDPIDKTITSFVVFVILASLSRRVIARYPLGERVVTPEPAAS